MPTQTMLTVKEIYRRESTLRKSLALGGTFDFHGSLLDLGNLNLTTYTPPQLPILQGVVAALYAKHRAPGLRQQAPTLTTSERMRDRAEYRPGPHQIVLPRYSAWGWHRLVLAHEIAHACTPSCGGGQRKAHGYEWQKQYAAVVSDLIGPEAGLLVMDALTT